MGGISDNALSHVASGETLIGIHGRSPPTSSKASMTACRFGSIVQITGGSGTT
jgi:hypothetical protein